MAPNLRSSHRQLVVAVATAFGIGALMLSRGEFRSVTIFQAPHRGIWMFAVGDTRRVWDGHLPDIGLDASADQAKQLAEEIVRRDWSISGFEWRLDQRGAWTAVAAPSPDTTADTTGRDEPA